MRNGQVAALLETIADLLEIKGESTFRVGAYREAARRVSTLSDDVEAIFREHKLEEIPGVGPSIAAKIDEYLKTGRSTYLESLRAEVPPGLVELLQVPGLGPRKARLVHDSLGIRSIEELAASAREHKLRTLPGLGPKTEDNLLREIERLDSRSKRMLMSTAMDTADEVIRALTAHPAVACIEAAGSLRRRLETIGDIDLVAASDRPELVMEAFVNLPFVKEIVLKGPTKTSLLTYADLQIDLRVVEPSIFGSALQYFTGSKAHNVALRDLALRRGYKLNEYGLFRLDDNRLVAGADEAGIYAALGLQTPPPEIRENAGEIEAAARGALPHLVEESDLMGDLHLHTDWSDGTTSIEAIVQASIARGYSYIAITDHSRSLPIANGLSIERLREQRAAVDALNAKYAPFRILAGSEIEIRGDGSIDYPPEVLALLDLVTVSLHSARGQSSERATNRVLLALGGGGVAVLNHPSGRIIGRRAPFEVDLEQVLRRAAATGTALEINASPDRLDLNDAWARRAKELGAKLTVSTDAHAPSQLDFMRYGIAVARRAWLQREDVLNARPVESLLAVLRRDRPAA